MYTEKIDEKGIFRNRFFITKRGQAVSDAVVKIILVLFIIGISFAVIYGAYRIGQSFHRNIPRADLTSAITGCQLLCDMISYTKEDFCCAKKKIGNEMFPCAHDLIYDSLKKCKYNKQECLDMISSGKCTDVEVSIYDIKNDGDCKKVGGKWVTRKCIDGFEKVILGPEFSDVSDESNKDLNIDDKEKCCVESIKYKCEWENLGRWTKDKCLENFEEESAALSDGEYKCCIPIRFYDDNLKQCEANCNVIWKGSWVQRACMDSESFFLVPSGDGYVAEYDSLELKREVYVDRYLQTKPCSSVPGIGNFKCCTNKPFNECKANCESDGDAIWTQEECAPEKVLIIYFGTHPDDGFCSEFADDYWKCCSATKI